MNIVWKYTKYVPKVKSSSLNSSGYFLALNVIFLYYGESVHHCQVVLLS